MTTREEIREGMIVRLDQILISLNVNNHREQAERIIDKKFLPYLNYQGVVIKVERELPDFETFYASTDNLIGEAKRQALLKYIRDLGLEEDGYVAVEPLI